MSIPVRLSNGQIVRSDNRKPSPLQRQILTLLAERGAIAPAAEGFMSLRGFLRTGEIVDGLGRRRDKAGFASVSRSLDRLCRGGLVVAARSQLATRGAGCFYALKIAPAAL